MIVFALACLAFSATPALLFFLNLRLLRPIAGAAEGAPNASILIPARDEEKNIEAAVRSALAAGAREALVLDDGSTDRTAEIVRCLAREDERVRLLAGAPLPGGWSGKNFACAQLATAARGRTFIFVDADVRLTSGAVARLEFFLRESGARLVSGIPRQELVTFSEKLLLPLIHFILLGFLPIRRMRRSVAPSYGAGCGQLMVCGAEAYRAAGGHAAIRASRHDGLNLPKQFRRAGFPTDLFDATDLATCRMYRTNGAVWRGLAKNAHEGLGAPRLILPMTLILAFGQIAPFVLIFFARAPLAFAAAVTSIVLILAPRLAAARRFHQPIVSALLHPLGISALLTIQWCALFRRAAGCGINWKGRSA